MSYNDVFLWFEYYYSYRIILLAWNSDTVITSNIDQGFAHWILSQCIYTYLPCFLDINQFFTHEEVSLSKRRPLQNRNAVCNTNSERVHGFMKIYKVTSSEKCFCSRSKYHFKENALYFDIVSWKLLQSKSQNK